MTGADPLRIFESTYNAGSYKHDSQDTIQPCYRDDTWYMASGMNYHELTAVGNPVMLDGGVLAFYTNWRVHLIGALGDSSGRSSYSIDVSPHDYYGLLAAGNDLYVVYRDYEVVYAEGWGASKYTYQVALVDVDAPNGPIVFERTDVPGLPMGTSEDGSLIFTASSWLSEEPDSWMQTLNVVSIEDGVGTIEWAIDMRHHEFRLMGDNAVISRIITYEVGYEDGGIREFKATHAIHVDLVKKRIKWVYSIVGAAQLSYAAEDLVFMSRPGENEMMIIDLRDHAGSSISRVPLFWYGYGIERTGNIIHVPLGMKGVQTVWLKTFGLPWE
jgi:hypothetical protein